MCLNLVIFTTFWFRIVASMPGGSAYSSDRRKTSLKSCSELYIFWYVWRSILNHHIPVLCFSGACKTKIKQHEKRKLYNIKSLSNVQFISSSFLLCLGMVKKQLQVFTLGMAL